MCDLDLEQAIVFPHSSSHSLSSLSQNTEGSMYISICHALNSCIIPVHVFGSRTKQTAQPSHASSSHEFTHICARSGASLAQQSLNTVRLFVSLRVEEKLDGLED